MNDRDRFFRLVKFFVWNDPYFFKYCADQVFRRCILDNEVRSILSFCKTRHVGGILVEGRLQLKFFNVDSTGPLYLGMLLNTIRVTLGASSWVQ